MASLREDLERSREVLFMALDGDRALQRGEQSTYTEPAASVVRALLSVVKELYALGDGSEELSPVDELANQRAARKAGTDDSAHASRRGQSRRSGRSNRSS